jgi:hypothetical protein
LKSILLFVVISLFACQSKKQSPMEIAIENKDTALAMKLAKQKLDEIRASIKDSGFAASIDAGLLIQTLQFSLEKADSLRISNRFSNELILNHTNGYRLYEVMMKKYKQALEVSSNADDVIYFTTESSLAQKEWLDQKFSNKKTYEALISLLILQRDIALISAIENKVDNQLTRLQLEKSYQQIIDNMKKSY